MKKGFLLTAALFVFGGSTMVANTVTTATTMEQSVVENNDENVKYVYRIQIYDKNTHELLHTEVGCFTGEEAVEMAEALIDSFGGYDTAYAMVAVYGEC